MARTKPVKSVVEVLRRKLGLHQDEFAKRVGLSRRTLQNLEYGSPLSWKNARAISLQFNVSADWLMANDPSAPMITEGGEPWSLKTQGKLQRALKAVDPALSKALFSLLSEKVIAPLLEDYLKFKTCLSVAALIDQKATVRWHTIQNKAWSEFLKINPAISEALSREPAAKTPLSRADLESIKEDVELVIQMPLLPEKGTTKSREQLRRPGRC
jgi:DNA-binding XRE family transcriptional regulator